MKNFDFCEIALVLFTFLVFFMCCWGVARFLHLKYGITFSTPSKFPRPEVKVKARLTFYSPTDGWHVNFYNGSVLCYGILTNLDEDDAKVGDEVDTLILEGPNAECGFYCLCVLN